MVHRLRIDQHTYSVAFYAQDSEAPDHKGLQDRHSSYRVERWRSVLVGLERQGIVYSTAEARALMLS